MSNLGHALILIWILLTFGFIFAVAIAAHRLRHGRGSNGHTHIALVPNKPRGTPMKTSALSIESPSISPREGAHANEVAHVLMHLNSMKPFDLSSSKSKVERYCNRGANFSLWIAAALFLSLLGMAAAKLFDAFPKQYSWIALYAGAGSSILALLSLTLQLLGGLYSIAFFRKQSDRDRVAECDHDFANILPLHTVSSEVLRQADRWLEMKQKLIEHRMGFFFGGSDKVALFAVVGAGWLAWKEIGRDITSWTLSPTLLGACFLTGLALGGMMSRTVLARIAYQRGLLTLAIGSSVSK